MTAAAPELLADLAGHVARIAAQAGLEDAIAESVGNEVAQAVATAWGGQTIYMPSGWLVRVSQVHDQIWARFNGHNHNELAREFRVSRQWIYTVVRRMRAADLAARQGALFPASKAPADQA